MQDSGKWTPQKLPKDPKVEEVEKSREEINRWTGGNDQAVKEIPDMRRRTLTLN